MGDDPSGTCILPIDGDMVYGAMVFKGRKLAIDILRICIPAYGSLNWPDCPTGSRDIT